MGGCFSSRPAEPPLERRPLRNDDFFDARATASRSPVRARAANWSPAPTPVQPSPARVPRTPQEEAYFTALEQENSTRILAEAPDVHLDRVESLGVQKTLGIAPPDALTFVPGLGYRRPTIAAPLPEWGLAEGTATRSYLGPRPRSEPRQWGTVGLLPLSFLVMAGLFAVLRKDPGNKRHRTIEADYETPGAPLVLSAGSATAATAGAQGRWIGERGAGWPKVGA